MRIRLVGPLTVERGDEELTGSALGGVRERRLLAILALADGAVVPKDVIIERLWDHVPRNPAAAVDTAVSLTRRALGSAATVLETFRPGIPPPGVRTDLGELDQLVAGAQRWDDAVALSDGELLASDPGSEWLEQRRREFELRRLDVLLGVARAAAARGADALASIGSRLRWRTTRSGRTPIAVRWRPSRYGPGRRGAPDLRALPATAARGARSRSVSTDARAVRADPRRALTRSATAPHRHHLQLHRCRSSVGTPNWPA